ncbi:MAG: adenylate/guanylate cyclase domain-containing protein, partial [Alphaproteobacteria bacterium]
VAGYSRLMGEDEEGTLRTLNAYRAVIDGLMAGHRGRVFGSAGDSVVAEFASAVEAVRCAVEIQEELEKRNADLPDDRRMRFRIGVNLGDVMIEGDNLLGDGVNVAARLESIAEPGGICLSGSVFEQVKGKLESRYEDLGKQEVKNIAEPVRVYRIRLESEATRTATDEKAARPSLPAKPSLAVLPFVNMSGDPEQEYFVDGITEDIITELSRFRALFVIARNSSFIYKGRAVKVQEVGKDLGVHYVVEGSVRKAGNRVRVTAQLVEAATGNHVWAERYDRDLEDIFAVQDEVSRTIVGTLAGRLEAAGVEQAKRKPTDNMAAYDYLLRGNEHHHRGTKDDNAQALRALEKAIELDPGCAPAYAQLACTLGQAWARGYLEDRDEVFNRCFENAQKAYSLDDDDSECHRILAAIHLFRQEHEQAEFHLERGLALNPNDPRIVSLKGELLTVLGQPEEGLEWVEKALRLDPHHPDGRSNDMGRALFVARRYQEAVRAFKRIPHPNHLHHAFLAACYAQMGNVEEAQAHTAEVLRMDPDFSVDKYLTTLAYKHQADRQHHRDGLIKAGLPG